MTINEKLKKALNNLDHLGWEIKDMYHLTDTDWSTKLIFQCKTKQGKILERDLDFLANFAWCPYCNEALADDPICRKCGNVSGADAKWYEYGKIKRHYRFKCIDYVNCGQSMHSCWVNWKFSEDELRAGWNTLLIDWNGTLNDLNKLMENSIHPDHWVFEEIDEWEE